MSKKLRRILIALIVSCVGLGINQLFYYYSKPDQINVNEQIAMAIVIETGVRNQRKLNQSELWQDLLQGDQLYSGDTLRTSEDSQLKIKFLNNSKIFNIEPDSLLVMQLEQGHINLNVLDGNIFVQKKSTDKQKFNEQKKEILFENNSSTAEKDGSLENESVFATTDGESNGNSDTKLNSEILIKNKEGEILNITGVSMDSKMVISAKEESNSIAILKPQDNEELFIDAENPNSQTFEVSSTRADESLELWLGTSRKNLKKIKILPPSELSTKLELKPGNYFWQFQSLSNGKGNKTRKSKIQSLKVLALYPPQLVSPLNNSVIKFKKTEDRVELKWQNTAEDYESLTVELFAEDNLKRPLFSEIVNENNHWLAPILPSGVYFWRLRVKVKRKEVGVLTSATFQFTLVAKQKMNIELTWDEKSESTQFFTGEEALLNIGWKMQSNYPIRSYKLHIKDENEKTEDLQVVNDPYFVKKLRRSGRVTVSVDAFDEDGERVGQLPAKTFDVRPMPLLPSVTILGLSAGLLETNDQGQIDINWNPVPKASAYFWELLTKEGRSVEHNEILDTNKKFEDLLPGLYRLQVQAIDRWGRKGDRHPATQILVPLPQSLTAPTIKKLEVQ